MAQVVTSNPRALTLGPLSQTYDATRACLDFVEQRNNNQSVRLDDFLEVYEHVRTVEFPKDANGKIGAMVHRELQDNDYRPLKRGDPLFETFSGEVISYQEDELLYPVFINEAAYYYQNIAFSLTKKTKMKIAEKPV